MSEAMKSMATELETYDSFKPSQFSVQLLTSAILPRAAFRNHDTGELVQLQHDRFGFNWIKTGDDHQYPHSEATLERFLWLFRQFMDFADKRGLGEINIVQCELTNVNVVLVSDVGEAFSDMQTVFKLPQLGDDFSIIDLENQMAGSKHLIRDDEGKPIGRVHSMAQPALKVPSNEEAYRFDISARGAPLRHGGRRGEGLLRGCL